MTKIFEIIYQNRESNIVLLSVLKKAFNENDEKKLLKLRCNLLKELDLIELEIELTQPEQEVLNDLKSILIQSNLEKNVKSISNLITTAHLATISSLYRSFTQQVNYITKNELEEIYENLPNEDKDFLNELKSALDDFFIEFRIKGNRAYKSLYLRIIGILALYKEDIKNSKHKDIFASVLQKAEFGVRFTENLATIANNSKKFLDILF